MNKYLGIICGVLVGLLAISVIYIQKLQGDRSTLEQNLLASNTELNTTKLKNNEILYERNSYILTIKELEEKVGVSEKTIKKLEKELKSKVTYISNIKTQIVIDTIYMTNIVTTTDTITNIDFNYKDNWLDIAGNTNIDFYTKESSTILYNINMDAAMNVGLTEDYKIFVKTDNPYINITDIQGASINPKTFESNKPYWSYGLQLGMGLMYDIFNKNAAIGPYIGAGVQYNF